MKATREGAICNGTLAQRWNALSTTRCLTTAALPPDVLRLRRQADIVFGEADPPQRSFSHGPSAPPPSALTVAYCYRLGLPLRFVQLLPNLLFLAANVAEVTLEKR